MSAVTQFQVKVNGSLLYSSENQAFSESQFEKAKKNHADRYVQLEKVEVLSTYKPALRATLK